MKRQKYEVAVSYASEQRPYVERFVARLQSQKMRVYYDRNRLFSLKPFSKKISCTFSSLMM